VGLFQRILRLIGQRRLARDDVNRQELAEVGPFLSRLVAITVDLLAGLSDALEVGKDLALCHGVASSAILSTKSIDAHQTADRVVAQFELHLVLRLCRPVVRKGSAFPKSSLSTSQGCALRARRSLAGKGSAFPRGSYNSGGVARECGRLE
jgi:hypothetical protein